MKYDVKASFSHNVQTPSAHAYYASPAGTIRIETDGAALTALRFVDKAKGDPAPDLPILRHVRCWLDIYFSGREPDFMPPLRMYGTSFRHRVWQELLRIPYATTSTYGDIARRLGIRSAQAVGGAVGANPVAIIVPCHRVIGANGKLVGYEYGLECKRILLETEQGKL